MVKGYETVWFNKEQKKQFDDLKKKGLISSDFTSFVRNAYFEALDKVNVELITHNKIVKQTFTTPPPR